MTYPSPQIPNDLEEYFAEVEAYMETLVTEDDTPVDNMYSDYQRRLLVDPLRSSWRPVDENGVPRTYIAVTDVGIFYGLRKPPIVPDMLLSMDVEAPAADWWKKKNRSYFTWEFYKPPDLVVEIVSNREGGETGSKLRDYAFIRINHYVVYDPGNHLGDEVLRIFKLDGQRYVPSQESFFPELGLGLKLWEGSYESSQPTTWLRWCDALGKVFLTGAERAELAISHAAKEAERAEKEAERAEKEAERAEKEAERAEKEAERAEKEAERAEKEAERNRLLAAKLRELGVDPDQI